jgi:CTP synthase (UTP-ammonia lyase)
MVPVACPVLDRADGEPKLVGGLIVRLRPGSRARDCYGRDEIEAYHWCSFEVNPGYRDAFERGGIRTAGVGPQDEIRVVELADHPFFVATLFQPQRASRPGAPDPLVVAFVDAARQATRRSGVGCESSDADR